MHRMSALAMAYALLAWPAFAAPPLLAPQSMNFTVEGKITKHSPGKLTLSTEENMIFVVKYDDQTEIKRPDGSKGAAQDFRVGVKVRIEGDLTESGEVVAQKIEIEPEAEKRPTAPDVRLSRAKPLLGTVRSAQDDASGLPLPRATA